MKKLTLSYDCREQMEAWLRAHCPCAFDDPGREFYRGLLVICQEEVNRAIAKERAKVAERIRKPSDQ
jgi:hypothetical protein